MARASASDVQKCKKTYSALFVPCQFHQSFPQPLIWKSTFTPGAGMGDPQKVAAATSWIRRMLDFIHRHPDGYSEDDVIWLIKAWVMVGKNWTNTGNPGSHGSKYGPF